MYMLLDNMNLNQMIRFEPTDEEMAMLDLDVVVYCKVTLVSNDKQSNYDFVKFLFLNEETKVFFKDYRKTLFYDFDGTHTDQAKFVTIFELFSLYNYNNVSEFLKETLESYNHEADVIIDLFTHDDKKYRLSNLDGIVKLEEMIKKN